ncbi:sigma-70 family RNA polymerase sigma factor [candidate division KSB1 bacterium]|nr:MAG: sigma-70 family RNA polymerase sigma factor [candidate division KSB1 bacterium]MBC6947821.1 sigma-70 family RNA polymerase sigma factor [candidate division KSB1 bacterium]MCE7943641.1 sigma-70 family RNA polymerase sigma factor [Chlorobi bacterium CHB1]MDL1875231.1 sigma-70 family RNA polymerase sigma factor [Cytophagia bacterium CHB2]
MPDDTFIGGSQDQFPLTRWSAIIAMRSHDAAERQRSREAIVTAYWKPVYKYLRLKWRKSNEDAKDLTQGFFAVALEKGYLENYDPAKARFRTFLRTCLDGYVANENKAAQRLKRGGGAEIIPLDFESAEGELQHLELADDENIEAYFETEWLRSLFALALDALREDCQRRGKQVHLQLFESYDLNEADAAKLTYDELATRFNLSVTQVTNHLSYIRREFRRILLEKLRELTGSEEEFAREARTVFGVDQN